MHTGPHVTRQNFVMVFMVMVWIAMTVRVGILQFLNHDQFRQRAQNQREKTVTIKGIRGRIVDRNGVQLAISMESVSYGIRPETVENCDETAAFLSGALGIEKERLLSIFESKKGFQWLIRQADSAVIEKLDAMPLECLERIPGKKRYYPLGKVAAQLVGYTDVDGVGIEGCEYFFNNELSGRDGRSILLRDARQRAMLSLDDPLIEPQDGRDMVLTIDWRIQEIAEEELDEGVARSSAQSGGAIVLDTETGEILAMANSPRFDPNDQSSFNASAFNPAFRKNRLVTDMFEPGSTFKIVVFCEALESGVISETDEIDCENGSYTIGSHKISDSHKMSVVPASDVLIHSSNIGTLKIATRIGKQRLYERARLLGFGVVTGFDIPDESPGMLTNPIKWSNLSLPTISFGQGVAVSPLQLAMAYAAVANGGILISPRIIKEIKGKGETPGKTSEQRKIRRAMSEETSRRLTELLCKVVEDGTGKNAAIPNLKIAGKTGTAQRVNEGGKGYAQGLFLPSFIGFIADRHPRILCLVMIDSPQGVYYGSQVAAPLFKNIMNRIINMGGNPWTDLIAESVKTESVQSKVLPNVKGMDMKYAVACLRGLGFSPVVLGDSTKVVKQFPLAGAELNLGAEVTLYGVMATRAQNDGIPMPDLIGKSMREAVQHLVQANLKVYIRGSGIVMAQKPTAGTIVKYGTVCTIACNKR